MSDDGDGGFRRRFFGVATNWSTYAGIFYLLLSFPLALASWVVLVVLLGVGGGLAITVVGIPLLVVTMYGWCFYADLERLFSNTLLGTAIRPLPFGSAQERRGAWAALRGRLSNSYTWRSLAFLLLVR
ncbi:MAG: sensor domain-containing protein, partial [bacterium]